MRILKIMTFKLVTSIFEVVERKSSNKRQLSRIPYIFLLNLCHLFLKRQADESSVRSNFDASVLTLMKTTDRKDNCLGDDTECNTAQ